MKTNAFILPLIEIVFTLAELLLGLRVMLKFFGANAAAPFVRWVYRTSEPLIEPFAGMFPAPVLDGQFIIEFSTLFALIVYSVVAYLLSEFIQYVRAIAREQRAERND